MGLAFSRASGMLVGWRGLGRFWLIVTSVVWITGAILQSLGPPEHRIFTARPEATTTSPAPLSKSPVAAEVRITKPAIPARPGRDVAGPITEPDPGLQEPAPGLPQAFLPRAAVDGQTPMRAYAAPFDPTNLRPRVGILIAGIGMSEADSMSAIKNLPGRISLAISPYATNLDRILAAARVAEDEYLLSVPMEPQGYPLNDPDDRHALMTALPPAENLPRLYWAMSRFAGYVGMTNAIGQLRGERLSAQADQLELVLGDAAHRGLLFVDARPGKPRLPLAWNRSVSIVIDDDPADVASLDARLDSLTHMALDTGSALGLVSLPRPKTLERVAAWTTTLAAKGLVLAPVSALVKPPVQEEQDK